MTGMMRAKAGGTPASPRLRPGGVVLQKVSKLDRAVRAGAAAVLAAAWGAGLMASSQAYDPVADPGAVVVSGSARFTVLTPRVVRMEWSPDGQFEDRASLAFVNRRLPVPQFSVERRHGRLEIRTEALVLRYLEDTGPFDRDNLAVDFRSRGEPMVWTPGMENAGDLKGTWRTLDNYSGPCPLEPGILSREGWTLVDDSRRPLLERTAQAPWPWATPRGSESAIDWYFFAYGSDYGQALRDFIAIAGRILLPPRYVFGAWWSRYWPYSDRDLVRLVGEFREQDVPLDVLVLDMDWHLEGWTGYTWNPRYFPFPERFLAWAHEQGLRVTLNVHPHEGVGRHEQAFETFCEAMGLDPEHVERIPFDPTDPRFVRNYFELLHHPLERQGVDFWWIDWQQGEKSRVPGLDPLFWLNYLHWMDWETDPGAKPDRPLIFSRWGGLGSHRYPIGFSGDTFNDWESLAWQPCFTSTAGNVGYAYWSHDIGGHQPGPVEPELYARWIQFGALSPVLRTHAGRHPDAERRIWAFEPEIFRVCREAWRLRYALLPYIYTMARKAYDEGLPLCRPLYYAWPELEEAYAHPGQYLFGDDLLVAPVAEPVNPHTRVASVRVWLPPGRWQDWFTGEPDEGPCERYIAAPLERLPLYVREGAVVPLAPPMRHSGEKPLDPLILHVFAGQAPCRFATRVYEDDGLTRGYQHGRCAWTPIACDSGGGRCRLEIGPMEGTFAGALAERACEVHIRNAPPAAEVRLDGTALRPFEEAGEGAAGFGYDAATRSLVIRTPRLATRQPVALDVTWSQAARAEGEAGRRASRAAAIETALAERRAAATPPGENLAGLGALLGLYHRLELAVAAGDPAVLEARVIAGSTVRPPVVSPDSLRCVLEVSGGQAQGGPVTLAPISEQDAALAAGSRRLELPEIPQTLLLRSLVSMRAGQLELEVPAEKVAFPSISAWWVAGPFERKDVGRLNAEIAGAARPDPEHSWPGKGGGVARWHRVVRGHASAEDPTREFVVELQRVFPAQLEDAAAYALTFLHSPEDRTVQLAVGSDDGCVVWVNGREYHRNLVSRPYRSRQDRFAVPLKAGLNTLVVRVDQHKQRWGFSVHVERPDSRPDTQVQVRLEP